MMMRKRAIVLLVVQCLLVSSIAVKYLYERATCPRVWTRAAQYDPELPMRGRYLALSPQVDACDLMRNAKSADDGPFGIRSFRARVLARDGKLVAEDARDQLPRIDFPSVSVGVNQPCDSGQLWRGIDYFVPETAASPFPLKPGQELWVEVTVPPSGPPRAIQLAISDSGKWTVLKFE
jgi:hypothetical protein